MHVRIAWEIYNHQQKQKGSEKKTEANALVPSTPSSLSTKPASSTSAAASTVTSSAPTTTKSSLVDLHAASAVASSSPSIGQKRPASGAPDFMHKRPATDADLLRSQLFGPPRPPVPPPPNPLDNHLNNPLLTRPPYMSPFGPSPLRKLKIFLEINNSNRIFNSTYFAESALSPFPRFGAAGAGGPPGAPFGGLGSLRDSALNIPITSHYNPLGSVATTVSDFLGLHRPGYPPTTSLFSSPTTSLGSSWSSTNSLKDLKVPKVPAPNQQGGVAPPLNSKDKLHKSPLESPGRSGNNGVSKLNGSLDHGRGHHGMRPSSSSGHSPLVNSSPSLDLSLKKEDHNAEITVVGEKIVPNGRSSVNPDRPHSSSSRSATPSKHLKQHQSDTKMMRPPLGPPPGHHSMASMAAAMHPFGLAGLYPGPAHGMPPPGSHHSPFGIDPFRDPYRAAAAAAAANLGSNPYLQSRESLLRLNQLMMTEQERIRMGLSFPGAPPPPPHTPISTPSLFPPPGATPTSSLLAKPPTLAAPPLGYPPGYHPGLGLPPLPSSAAPPSLNGSSGSGTSTYHAK